jgi:deoxyribonuclease-1
MKSMRITVMVLALVVVLLGAMGMPLPPEVARLLAELGIPVPKSMVETELSEVVAKPPHTAGSFSSAKRWLYEDVYDKHRKTFYCGCDFDEDKAVDPPSCGLRPRRNEARALRVEAEHVFPASQFGYSRRCWREPEAVCGKKISGRECCERADPVFEAAHNDLHNLFPAVGEVNGDRSNYRWGMIPGEKREYGGCNIEVDHDLRRAEPPEGVMGDIARAMFYMEKTYGFRLSDQQKKLLTAWHRQDPPDPWERERNRRIAKIQGRGNPFIRDR